MKTNACIFTIIPVCLAGLAGCSSSGSVSIAQSAYALGAALDTAEKAELAYEQSPLANQLVVTEVKALDMVAYNAVAPIISNGNNVTADEIVAAQAAVAALTQYLVAHGVKS
ncbi:MAG: hypothetical protein POG24_04755 [Acidocella sp.]|nr:hypothetical protein [Acidocella sp.]